MSSRTSPAWGLLVLGLSPAWHTGMRRSVISVTPAMYIAVGKESLLDWPMFTWSLGWTGALEPTWLGLGLGLGLGLELGLGAHLAAEELDD